MLKTAATHLRVGLIPGDGIGREVLPAAQRVLEAVSGPSFRVSFTPLDAGFEHFSRHGVALPPATVEALQSDCNCALFGAVSSPSRRVEGYSSPIVALRKKLDLYANVRPVKYVPIGPSGDTSKQVDMVVVRENTECLYVKEERQITDADGNVVEALATRRITERASRRIADIAGRIALARDDQRRLSAASGSVPRPKVTVVHKSNVLSITDGLFRETAQKVYRSNPEFASRLAVEEQLVDSMVYRMFLEPQVFDVAVAPNLYGDILSDGAAALVGSLGLVPSANVGDAFVMGEPVHGSAPDIEGKGLANPIAAVRSAAMLLEYMGHQQEAVRIHSAVDGVLREGTTLTADIGGTASTSEVTEAILRRL